MTYASMARRTIRVRLADLPGSLHQLTSLVAAEGVNIVRLEVVSRDQPDVWDDVEFAAEREEQIDRVVSALKSHGLTVIGLPAVWAIRDWATDVLHALERIGDASGESEAVEVFASTSADLANVEHAFVLMEPRRPDASAAETRWVQVQRAAALFDPDRVDWVGDDIGTRIVISAMRTARLETPDHLSRDRLAVGAVVEIPMSTRRPAHVVVVGERPAFLNPELARLEMFCQVAAPHLWAAQLQASA